MTAFAGTAGQRADSEISCLQPVVMAIGGSSAVKCIFKVETGDTVAHDAAH